MSTRSSEAASPEGPLDLVTDPAIVARIESENLLRQADEMYGVIARALDSPEPFSLRPSLIQRLNRTALDRLRRDAGQLRSYAVVIRNAPHRPPPAADVPELLEQMCDYVNAHWADRSPVHLAAYIMWRLNWIHPFGEGNGRTTRVVAYLVLCVRLGYLLPGARTIPEQIAEDRRPYYQALDDADEACRQGRIDVGTMESLVYECLAEQLAQVLRDAE